jgi:hypothetical protein
MHHFQKMTLLPALALFSMGGFSAFAMGTHDEKQLRAL